MQNDVKDIDELVDGFGRSAETEFSVAELMAHLRRKGIRADRDEIADSALTSEYLFEMDRDGYFVPRRLFFQGAQFRIVPLEAEIAGGYLMPGHRFMPFISREVFPAKARLVLPDGTAIATRKIAMPREMVQSLLLFYGPSGIGDYLLFENQANISKIMAPVATDLEVTVFDLRAFYQANGFRPGDALMLTVVDWLHGIFSVARVGSDADFASSRKWAEAMRYALEDAMDELGTEGDCYEQLALAMRNAQENPDGMPPMQAPPLSLPAFFNMQKDLAVKRVDENALFWDVDEDPMEVALAEALENPSEPESELDLFFHHLGLSMTEYEAEAYMRDALYHGQGNTGSVLARVTAGRHLLFASAEDQDEFHDLWNLLWDDVREEYDPTVDSCGEIRSRFLSLNDKILAVLRQLDAQNVGREIKGNPAFIELGRLSAMISSGAVLFNLPEQYQGDAANGVMDMLPHLDRVIDDLAGRLMPNQAAPAKKAAPANAGAIYQLKVSLKGAKPPIWRRILIPADMELADLHAAIQTAMGWYNCHLHQFKQGRTIYQPDPDDEFDGFGGFETVDYEGMCIGDLLRKEKDKIQYEYDFGDGWEHDVLLEKILEPAKGAAYPVCVKGKRACPPEDCGGIWGYYNLLEIIGNPKHKEHRSMLEWLGGKFDPEDFDLDEANARMRTRLN